MHDRSSAPCLLTAAIGSLLTHFTELVMTHVGTFRLSLSGPSLALAPIPLARTHQVSILSNKQCKSAHPVDGNYCAFTRESRRFGLGGGSKSASTARGRRRTGGTGCITRGTPGSRCTYDYPRIQKDRKRDSIDSECPSDDIQIRGEGEGGVRGFGVGKCFVVFLANTPYFMAVSLKQVV